MYRGIHKKSGTTRLLIPDGTRLHSFDESLDFLECFGSKLVVNPPSIFAVANDPSVLENPQMEGQPGLCGVESIGQLAHTALSLAKQLDDLESGLVGEGVKELDCALGAGIGCNCHDPNISRKVVGSRSRLMARCR